MIKIKEKEPSHKKESKIILGEGLSLFILKNRNISKLNKANIEMELEVIRKRRVLKNTSANAEKIFETKKVLLAP